jgi:hypothetical protein
MRAWLRGVLAVLGLTAAALLLTAQSNTNQSVGMVTTNGQLKLLPSYQYSMVWRMGVNQLGDAPTQGFASSSSPCTIVGGDVGSQVPSADGGCFNVIAPSSGLDLLEFGAVAYPAAGDNNTAIQKWANQACAFRLTAPNATFNFQTAPIVFPLCNRGQIVAGGMYGFTLNYVGAATTPDIVLFGDPTYKTSPTGWRVDGLNVTSQTQMTNGAGIHIGYMVASSFDHSNAGGQYSVAGTPKLWNGIWCDFCFDVWYWNFEASGANDGVRASGRTTQPNAGFYYGNCKISNSGVGLHLGGASGAIDSTNCQIIANGTNVVIDHSIVAAGNYASVFDGSTAIDTSTSGPGVLINDNLFVSNQVMIFNDTWNCTQKTYGLYIQAINGQQVDANFAALCNNYNDGLRVDDAAAKVYLAHGEGIYSNGISGTGYGINATALNQSIYLQGRPSNNASGNWNAKAFLGTAGGCSGVSSCWYKDFAGNITQYFQANFTGAANTMLLATPSFPVAFPNTVAGDTEQCTPYGMGNGPELITTGAALRPTLSNAEIFLLSSVTVTTTQVVNCVIKGS